MENHHFEWENPLSMVIFRSIVAMFNYQRVVPNEFLAQNLDLSHGALPHGFDGSLSLLILTEENLPQLIDDLY